MGLFNRIFGKKDAEPEKKVEQTEAKEFNETVRPLTQDELDTIEMVDLDVAYSICKRYLNEFDGTFTATILDQVFALWLDDTAAYLEKDYDSGYDPKSGKKPTPTMIVYGLGGAFGDILNKKFKSNWIHLTDNFGEAICIRHAQSSYTAFPYSSVQKRIESKENTFFGPIMAMMEMGVK